MSQPQPGVVSRQQAIESLREILNKDTWQATDPKWKRELSKQLKDFAAKYFELSLKEHKQEECFDIEMLMHKDEPSKLWHAYFVLSLRKILKDLPASTADLRKAVDELVHGDDDLRKAVHEFLHGDGNAAKGNPALPAASSASPATLSATPRTDVNNNNKIDVNNKKKRPATEHDDMETPNKTKRVKTEADAASFTVHARSLYTVRVFEGDILSAEFSSSTPATVRVKMVPGSAASAAAVVNCDESDN